LPTADELAALLSKFSARVQKDYAESDSDWKASGQPKLLPAGQVNWGRHGRIFELNANGTAAYIWRTGETVELIVCSDLIIIPATLVTAVYQQF